jgi:hypothetical protein
MLIPKNKKCKLLVFGNQNFAFHPKDSYGMTKSSAEDSYGTTKSGATSCGQWTEFETCHKLVAKFVREPYFLTSFKFFLKIWKFRKSKKFTNFEQNFVL